MKRSFITNSKLKLTSRTLPENLDQQKMFALPESYFPPPNSVEFRRSIIHVLKCVLTAPKVVRRGSRVAEKQTRTELAASGSPVGDLHQSYSRNSAKLAIMNI